LIKTDLFFLGKKTFLRITRVFFVIAIIWTISFYAQAYEFSFDNPKKIPYQIKQYTKGVFSRWGEVGFDSNKKRLWIQYLKKPISYMVYRVIRINKEQFYRFDMNYEAENEMYFSIFIQYFRKDFKPTGIQMIYKDTLLRGKNNLSLEFKPSKPFKKAIIFLAIWYAHQPSKLYIEKLSLFPVEKLYSNLDDLYVIPNRENIKVKICYSGRNSSLKEIAFSFLRMDTVDKLGVKEVVNLGIGKRCISRSLKLSDGIYLYEYSIDKKNPRLSKRFFVWITSDFEKLKEKVYIFNAKRKLFLKTIEDVTFLNFSNVSAENILFEPFGRENVFSSYYPIQASTYFNDRVNRKFFKKYVEEHNFKDIFIITGGDETENIEMITRFFRELKGIANLYLLKRNDLNLKKFKPFSKFYGNDITFLNDISEDILSEVRSNRLALNYHKIEKFLPLLYLKKIVEGTAFISSSNLPSEYSLYIDKNGEIVVIKYSTTAIDEKLFPTKEVLERYELILGKFGYDTDKKIFVLRYQGELPFALEKTIEGIYIAPRTFYLPKATASATVFFENFFNSDIYLKHTSITGPVGWQITIEKEINLVKKGEKIKIPFSVALPSRVAINTYLFNLLLIINHPKVGDVPIKKVFTLSIKSKEFFLHKVLRKEKKTYKVILNFKNKKRKRYLYQLVAFAGNNLIKEEISFILPPKKKESILVEFNNVRSKVPVTFVIKNLLDKSVYFVEVPVK
jgi:hypothetical protein